MIIKKIDPRTGITPSFAGLAKYITDSQGRDNRVGDVIIRNCIDNEDFDIALLDIARVKKMNIDPRVKNKTLHLLLSFDRTDKIPTLAEREDFEKKCLSSLGFENCQYISVAHHDTDNFHIHLAINRVDPADYHMHKEVLGDEKIMARIAMELENEHSLKQTNHNPKKSKSQNNVDNMEAFSGIESFASYIRDRKIVIENAKSWEDLHRNLSKIGVTIKKRGNGLIFISNDGNMKCKASTVSRSFSISNLESRLGEFQDSVIASHKKPIVSYEKKPLVKTKDSLELYIEYTEERNNKISAYQDSIKDLKKHHSHELEYQILRLSDEDSETAAYVMKYLRLLDQLSYRREEARKKKLKNASAITYRSWLQREALNGNLRAQTVLEKRGTPQQITPIPVSELNAVLKQGVKDYVSAGGAMSIIYRNYCYRVNSDRFLLSKTPLKGVTAGQTRQYGLTINLRPIAKAQSALRDILQRYADRFRNVGAIITNHRELRLPEVQIGNVAVPDKEAPQVLLHKDVPDHIRQPEQEPNGGTLRRDDIIPNTRR